MEPDFAAVRLRIVGAGLLDRAYASYAILGSAAFGILIAGVSLMTLAPVLAAVLIAFGSIQVALIGHDAGHLGIFQSKIKNHVAARVCWSLALGVCFAYWNDRHTRHHASPNHTVDDPDLQWAFGPALTPLMAFTLRVEGWRFALRTRNFYELGLLVANTVGWLALLVVLGPSAIPTLLASQVLASVYLALVVAPNHVGMPTWPASAQPTYLEAQLLSSRNVLPHAITDFVFGGLNYQIEHHLFPSMPRRNLARARQLVKPFCAANGLPYTEQGVFDVYRSVLTALPEIAKQGV